MSLEIGSGPGDLAPSGTPLFHPALHTIELIHDMNVAHQLDELQKRNQELKTERERVREHEREVQSMSRQLSSVEAQLEETQRRLTSTRDELIETQSELRCERNEREERMRNRLAVAEHQQHSTSDIQAPRVDINTAGQSRQSSYSSSPRTVNRLTQTVSDASLASPAPSYTQTLPTSRMIADVQVWDDRLSSFDQRIFYPPVHSTSSSGRDHARRRPYSSVSSSSNRSETDRDDRYIPRSQGSSYARSGRSSGRASSTTSAPRGSRSSVHAATPDITGWDRLCVADNPQPRVPLFDNTPCRKSSREVHEWQLQWANQHGTSLKCQRCEVCSRMYKCGGYWTPYSAPERSRMGIQH
ncbi:hypothetical protein BXZ70DRAFT_367773 [Cristinia sonorae]|uniref:Uncharacterized protein n=1 Tax=Cristinia sonorae TaxID=1940300 RepID=A0A8K0UIY1_9AGAR|nr:hypothetical protein BXZ70DRAFT_367773 [Cristinia sonorae]